MGQGCLCMGSSKLVADFSVGDKAGKTVDGEIAEHHSIGALETLDHGREAKGL
jgi:hypothetical protein